VRLVDAAALLVAVAELSALPQLSETPVQSQNTPLPPSCRLVFQKIAGRCVRLEQTCQGTCVDRGERSRP
jgi:hypothetical protein